jgi:hypothetical protein
VVVVQESTPESPSVAVAVIVTGARYQPAAFGGRAGAAVVAGAWESYRTVKLPFELLPARSVQLPLTVVPPVSGPE